MTIRTIDTYRSVSRTVTALITFNDQHGGDTRPFCVERKDDGVNYGFRWYKTEDAARLHANDWIEHPNDMWKDTMR